MKCWFCGGTLIWNNDYNYEDYGLDGEGIVSVLVCSECGAMGEGYKGVEDEID